jgi:hypothetical protein
MSKFDWSLLDRFSLHDLFKTMSKNVVGKSLSIDKIHRIFSNHLKKHLPIKVSKSKSKIVEFDYIYIGGTYYSDYDEDRKKCIEIVFNYNPFQESITLTQKKFNRLCMLFADTILHELIHMRQYRRRKFKILPDYASTADKASQREEQRYLGCTDEIDAYGFNIACELISKFKSNKIKIEDYLNEDQKGKRRKTNSWRMYLKAFDYDHQHPIIKRLKKKVIRYIPYAEIGKPYRNKDWISR